MRACVLAAIAARPSSGEREAEFAPLRRRSGPRSQGNRRAAAGLRQLSQRPHSPRAARSVTLPRTQHRPRGTTHMAVGEARRRRSPPSADAFLPWPGLLLASASHLVYVYRKHVHATVCGSAESNSGPSPMGALT